jgi:hypothetical protein
VGEDDELQGDGDEGQDELDLDAPDSEPDDEGAERATTPHWFAIPVWRLLVLSLLGGWFYQTYWMYRSWQAYRASWGYSRASEWHAVYERTGFRVSPFWRAFTGLYCYGLFVAAKREARVLGLQSWIAPWPMLAVWCVGSFLVSRIGPWPFQVVTALVFLPAQMAVNRISDRVTGSNVREPTSGGELMAAIAGALMICLVLARTPR